MAIKILTRQMGQANNAHDEFEHKGNPVLLYQRWMLNCDTAVRVKRGKEMRIGELARKTGVSVRMLRYYENQGLLTPRRTAAGYRMYANGDTERVRRIALLNRAGLSLATLRPVIACEVQGDADFQPCDALKETLQATAAELSGQIENLQRARAVLGKWIGASE
jgi:DNA-binding transcriptional MerR regulator